MMTYSARRRVGLATMLAFLGVACSSDNPNSVQHNDDETGAWGVMGDSGSDEYRADDNRGGPYGATTLNWIELLAKYRSFDFGPIGTRAEPRRSGFEYNWARSGATSASLLSSGQHTGLAAQIQAGLVENVILEIGVNDFSVEGMFDEIYNGTLAGPPLQDALDKICDNITLALSTVLDAGAKRVFWVSVGDRTHQPLYFTAYPDPSGLQAVSNAVGYVNARVTQYALTHGIIPIDLGALTAQLVAQVGTSGDLSIDGEVIHFYAHGDEPHNGVLSDNIHPGTVSEALLANVAIDVMRAHGVPVQPFTNAEILRYAGIRE